MRKNARLARSAIGSARSHRSATRLGADRGLSAAVAKAWSAVNVN